MIKASDYIAQRLRDFYGIKDVFLITGGGAMHLNNAIGTRIPYISNHHEQACAIAAEGYARSCGKLAVVNVTTGPGGLNCLNGVFGQWTDSVPVLYISGQVKFVTTLASCPELPLRQLGDPRQIRTRVARRSDERANRNDRRVRAKGIHAAGAASVRLKNRRSCKPPRRGKADKKWLDYSKNLRAKYAFENVPEYRQEKGVPVNVYNLTHTLTAVADPEDIFVVANGSPCICTCQCAVTKKGQRMFLNSGDASMGYDLPAAIGAAVANPDKKIICYTGDGSIMMNIQELQTIKTHNLPIRIFIIRNDGYSKIYSIAGLGEIVRGLVRILRMSLFIIWRPIRFGLKKTIGARISSAPYFPIKLRIGKPYLPLLERCAPLRKILS